MKLLSSPLGNKFNNSIKYKKNSASNWIVFTRRRDSEIARLNKYCQSLPQNKLSKSNEAFNTITKYQKKLIKSLQSAVAVHKKAKLQTCLKGAKVATCVGELVKRPPLITWVYVLINFL